MQFAFQCTPCDIWFCKWQLNYTGSYKPPRELVSDVYNSAHILDSNFKNLRAEGKVAAVKGEVSSSNNSHK
jgi:hypothetical protein